MISRPRNPAKHGTDSSFYHASRNLIRLIAVTFSTPTDAIANIPEAAAPDTFQAVSLAPKFRVDHSPHPEISACFRCIAPLFGQKRVQGETESVRARRCNHGSVWHRCDEGREA